jgi:hypothetical protein
MAASNIDMASWATVAKASVAAAICDDKPGPDSLRRRAARHTGHQAHSGASSCGSVVARSHTSPDPWLRPSADRI